MVGDEFPRRHASLTIHNSLPPQLPRHPTITLSGRATPPTRTCDSITSRRDNCGVSCITGVDSDDVLSKNRPDRAPVTTVLT